MNYIRVIIIGFSVFTIFSCNRSNQKAESENYTTMTIKDSHSFAKPEMAIIQHLDWNARVDFSKKIITGKAKYRIRADKAATEIVFDTKDLMIDSVLVNGEDSDFELGQLSEQAYKGVPLTVPINSDTKEIDIYYKTSDQAAALQWLSPEQTTDKQHPFLFTQSQAILARTWLPVQDSPGIRFTYQANVQVPAGLMALMSAENPTQISPDGNYSFKMEQPIPAYLMSLAVGDLVYHPIGNNTGVYAEPSVIESAAYEFADLENMLEAAEDLYGDYRWDKYDLLVLPSSFPFGGMENPRLTFVTPTILAGDRSLTALVAHELAHSWSGNLVTNATWNDFWLNEGFTVYFERRIMEELYGKSYADMLSILGYQDLKQTVKELTDEGKNLDTRLKLQLDSRDPDEGMTDIAYEKGYFFLKMLENHVGRENFDEFIIKYFNDYAFETITTEAFIEYLDKNLLEKHQVIQEEVQYEQWIYGEGIPVNMPNVTSERFAAVDSALISWQEGISADKLETKTWTSHEWLHFLRGLPEQLSKEQLSELDRAFSFTNSGNSEVLAAWFIHAIKHRYEPAYPRLESFLENTGRRKFLVPLYAELIKTEEGKKRAKNIYEKARPNYHFVSINTLDDLLNKQ